MSSHHFVREGQEPALYLQDVSSFEAVAPLLEWAPTIVVEGSQLTRVLSWGIRIDAVAAEANAEPAAVEQDIPRLVYDGDALDAAMSFLLEKGETAVNIVTGDFSAVREKATSWLDRLHVVVLDRELRWMPVRREFRKWVRAGEPFTVWSTQPLRHNMTTEGDQITAAEDGIVTITSESTFWVGELLKS